MEKNRTSYKTKEENIKEGETERRDRDRDREHKGSEEQDEIQDED